MKLRRKLEFTGHQSEGRIRINVEGTRSVEWQIAVKQAARQPVRHIPGGLVTKILCEREVELRLTRFVHSPPERLGFQIA